jgi:hypothetical protein
VSSLNGFVGDDGEVRVVGTDEVQALGNIAKILKSCTQMNEAIYNGSAIHPT